MQFPVNIKEPNARLATVIMSQYGGPDGEMGASMRYLSQRYAMPYKEVAGLLTDIGTDLFEDMAAEQKARSTYDNILRLITEPDVVAPIKFLREREIVHFQRFGEALRITQDKLNSRNFYAFNPGFDTSPTCE